MNQPVVEVEGAPILAVIPLQGLIAFTHDYNCLWTLWPDLADLGLTAAEQDLVEQAMKQVAATAGVTLTVDTAIRLVPIDAVTWLSEHRWAELLALTMISVRKCFGGNIIIQDVVDHLASHGSSAPFIMSLSQALRLGEPYTHHEYPTPPVVSAIIQGLHDVLAEIITDPGFPNPTIMRDHRIHGSPDYLAIQYLAGNHPSDPWMRWSRAEAYRKAGMSPAESRAIEFGPNRPTDEALATTAALLC